MPPGYYSTPFPLNPEASDDGTTNVQDRTRYWYSLDPAPATIRSYDSKVKAYTYTADNPRAAIFTGANTRYVDLELTTEGLYLERTIWTRVLDDTVPVATEDFTKCYTTNGIWADMLVQFTATPDPPEFTDDDRLIVWLRDDIETGGGSTLMVSAGYIPGERTLTKIPVKHYATTNAVQVDTWYRLTVKVVGDMTGGSQYGGKAAGFIVYLDGNPVIAEEEGYDIGQKSNLSSTFFNAESRLLVADRRLFPSVSRFGSDEAASLTRVAMSGIGKVDDISFCATNAVPFHTDPTVLTLKWDYGVKTLRYSLDQGVNWTAVDVTAHEGYFLDIVIGDAALNSAIIDVEETYKTDLTYRRGDWTGANGVELLEVNPNRFVYNGGYKNPTINALSGRDLVVLGGEGGKNTFVDARTAAINKAKTDGWPQTIGLGQNFTPSKSKDNYYVSVLNTCKGLILDLQGFALSASPSISGSFPIVKNTGGWLKIIDTSSANPTGSVNAAGYNPATTNIEFIASKPMWHVAVQNYSTTKLPAFLQIDAGYFNGKIETEPEDCVITGGHFWSTNSESFYLSESVTNTKYWAWNEPYWVVSDVFPIEYSYGLGEMPTNYVTRYTAYTPCTPLPVPTLEYHSFDGWWMSNQLYTTVGLGTGPTNSPHGRLDLTARWSSKPETNCYVWTGHGGSDYSWLNPSNWSYLGECIVPTSATDRVLFPAAEETTWVVSMGANAAKPRNWFVYGPVHLYGSNDFENVVLQGTNTMSGTATLVYNGRVPDNLEAWDVRSGTTRRYLASNWKGTVLVANVTNCAGLAAMSTWGVSGSHVIFNGVWANYTNRLARTIPYELILQDRGESPAWITDTGFTGTTLDFAKLSGKGTLVSTNGFRHPSMQVLKFRNAEFYEGRMYLTSKRAVFGSTLPANSEDGTATYGGGITVTGDCGWTFSNVVFKSRFIVLGTNGCAVCRYLGDADISACAGAGGIQLQDANGHLALVDGYVRAYTDAGSSLLSAAPLASGAAATTGGAAATGNDSGSEAASTAATAGSSDTAAASSGGGTSSGGSASSGGSGSASSGGSGTAANDAAAQDGTGTSLSSGSSSSGSSTSTSGSSSGTATYSTTSSATAAATGNENADNGETDSGANLASATSVEAETGDTSAEETGDEAATNDTSSVSSSVSGGSLATGVSILSTTVSANATTSNVYFVDSYTAFGTNFTNVVVQSIAEDGGCWTNMPDWQADKGGLIVKNYFSLTYPDGTVVTNSRDVAGRVKTKHSATAWFYGLTNGEAYVANSWAMGKSDPTSVGVYDLLLGWAEGRILTASNATNYYSETAATYLAGSEDGEWTDPYSIAKATNGLIYVDADLTETPDAALTFTPDEPESDHDGYLTSFKVIFHDIADELPSTDALYGFTVADDADGVTSFAYLDASGWSYVPTDVLEPQFDVEYRVWVKVDEKLRTVRYFVSPPNAPTVEVASYAVPEGTFIGPGAVDFSGRGEVRAATGELNDRDLYKLTLAVDPESTRAGTNFVSAGVILLLDFLKTHDTDLENGKVTITAKDLTGQTVGETTQTFKGTTTGQYSITIDGLTPGAAYTYHATVQIGDGTTYDAEVGADGMVVLGNPREEWIDEDGETFAGAAEGTGVWSNDLGVAYATSVDGYVNRSIAIRTEYTNNVVSFTPDTWPKDNEISLYQISTTMRFEDADLVSDDTNDWGGYAITYAADPGSETNGEYALAILHTNVWEKIPRAVFAPELEVDYVMSAIIDLYNTNITYYATPDGGTAVQLARWAMPTNVDLMFANIALHGNMTVHALKGAFYDPNLAKVGTNEYATISLALAARTNDTQAIEPLWYSTYDVPDGKGRFVTYDPNGYLNVIRHKWNWITITSLGSDYLEYYYEMSDNWIDYEMDTDEHYEIVDGVIHVKSPEGLAHVAWLGFGGTNFAGKTVVLDNALTNLAKHGWTPIPGFAGTFDGRGFGIKGLNDLNYRAAVSNEYGNWSFGLFDGTDGATIRNLELSEVAYTTRGGDTNGPARGEGVGALVGRATGSLAVSNVWVTGGTVVGMDNVGGVIGHATSNGVELADIRLENVTNEADVAIAENGFPSGTKVAGVLGFAENYASLYVAKSANAGDVVNPADTAYGDFYAAGLLTLAGGATWLSDAYNVTLRDNYNFGTVSNHIYRLWPVNDEGLPTGGNVAQIAANASDREFFGTVDVSGNAADGTVLCSIGYNDDRLLGTVWPMVNFASCFATYDDLGYYKFFIDANADATPIDPVKHLARMSQARFENDQFNGAGHVNDIISATAENGVATFDSSVVTWDEIVCDRNITIDMNSYVVEATFFNVAFRATGGADVTIQNGVIYADEGLFYAVDAGSKITFNNVTFQRIGDARTTVAMNGMVFEASEILDKARSNYTITIPTTYEEDLVIDDTAKTITLNGVKLGEFKSYYDITKSNSGGMVTVSIELNDTALPTIGSSLSPTPQNTPSLLSATPSLATAAASVFAETDAAEETPAMMLEGGYFTLNALSTYTGLYYGLQHKESMDAEWEPVQDWYKGTDGKSLQISAPADGENGFYRVNVTDHEPKRGTVVNEDE